MELSYQLFTTSTAFNIAQKTSISLTVTCLSTFKYQVTTLYISQSLEKHLKSRDNSEIKEPSAICP